MFLFEPGVRFGKLFFENDVHVVASGAAIEFVEGGRFDQYISGYWTFEGGGDAEAGLAVVFRTAKFQVLDVCWKKQKKQFLLCYCTYITITCQYGLG